MVEGMQPQLKGDLTKTVIWHQTMFGSLGGKGLCIKYDIKHCYAIDLAICVIAVAMIS